MKFCKCRRILVLISVNRAEFLKTCLKTSKKPRIFAPEPGESQVSGHCGENLHCCPGWPHLQAQSLSLKRVVTKSVKQHGSWCVFRAVLPRRTRIFNLIEKLLNRIAALKPRLFHTTDFRVIPFSYTLAKFTTLKCSSLINTALFNTTPKAPKYLSFDSMPKKQFCRCSLYVDVSNYTTSLPTPWRW